MHDTMDDTNPINTTVSMESDSRTAGQDTTYGTGEPWVDVNAYHPTKMSEYGSFYTPNIAPMPSSHHSVADSLSSEPINRIPPLRSPVNSTSMHHTPHHPATQPPSLPMLITPGVPQWPSMLTNPAGGGAYSTTSLSAPPLSVPPLSVTPTARKPRPPPRPAKGKGPGRGTQPRRTLTDEDRRQMCLYQYENPLLKQTEIGAKFKVERR